MGSNIRLILKSLLLQCFLRKMGWRYFWEANYYYKWLEYPLAVSKLNLSKKSKILDIGSGKSFLPLYFLYKGLEVWTVDKSEFYSDFPDFYLDIVKKQFSHDKYRNLHALKGDFLNIDLPLEYYDNILAISSFEHLKDTNDIKAMHRITTLLKNGGRFVITIPFSQDGTKERFIKENEFSYFQRDYELNCVYKRIIEPSRLNFKEYIVIGERFPLLARRLFFSKPFTYFNFLWSIILTNLFWKVYYRGKSINLKQFKYPGLIVLVFEK